MSDSAVRIWLCADDYGISLSVNAAIRTLLAQRRINAASVMVVAPSFQQSEATALAAYRSSGPRAAIGLHVTLTAPFRPMTKGFAPQRAGTFLPLRATLLRALLRRYRHDLLVNEIAAQLDAFFAAFGHPPDFVDGHQHVQLFPQVREAFLEAVRAKAPQAWVRQCSRAVPLLRRLGDPKGLLLDLLSRPFRARATAFGLRTNPSFAGTYNLSGHADYALLFLRFLEGLSNGSVIMCHPGRVDDELERLDSLTDLRERECDYFADEKFPSVLTARGVELAAVDAGGSK